MNLPATRATLLGLGAICREARPCKQCAREIEIWRTPGGKPIALEVLARDNWRLHSHAEICQLGQAGAAAPSPAAKAQQGNLFGRERVK
jgi:hypothetical protein